MTGAATRRAAYRHERSTGSFLWGAVLFFAGCTNTPIEAILAEDDAREPQPPERGLDGCDAVSRFEPGRFRLVLSEAARCLALGDETLVRGRPAFEVNLVDACSENGASWDLISTSGLGPFELRNVEAEFNLDIELASAEQGTRAVLYEPHELNNQRFVFRPRGASRFEIAPLHVRTMCLTDAGSQAEIWPCDDEEPAQDWLLFPEPC